MTETAYLGLGSNLGDRLGTLQRAVDLLGAERGITLRAARACGKPPRSAARPSPIS